MDHKDHVNLIRDAIPQGYGIWADLGAGEGAFTLALADITNSQTEIYSVDTDDQALDIQKEQFENMFPRARVHYIIEDFTKPLDLPFLDGIIMANALHYVEAKIPFLKSLHSYLKPSGRLVLVEYNVDFGNHWVPFPLSYKTFEVLSQNAGFKNPRLVSTIPSDFLNEIYSACADNAQ